MRDEQEQLKKSMCVRENANLHANDGEKSKEVREQRAKMRPNATRRSK